MAEVALKQEFEEPDQFPAPEPEEAGGDALEIEVLDDVPEEDRVAARPIQIVRNLKKRLRIILRLRKNALRLLNLNSMKSGALKKVPFVRVRKLCATQSKLRVIMLL